MTTIRDVAQRAQVSPGTVSQMLNGRARPQPKTRQRIEQAIADLDYRPGKVGRPRNRAAVRHIAVVLPGQRIESYDQHPLVRRRINAIRGAVVDSGESFGLFTGRDHIKRDWPLQDAVRNGDIDGAILCSCRTDDGYANWLLEQSMPLVVLERFPVHHEFSYVAVDNHIGGRLAADHLVELGHRQLAFVHATNVFDWTRLRRVGLESFAAEADLPKPVIAQLDPDIEGIDHLIEPIKTLIDAGVTAVFAAGDGLAIRTIDAAEHLGLRVPEDLSVIGFDDLGYRSRSGLRPTTLAYDTLTYAQLAVNMVRQLLDTPAQLSHLAAAIKPQLIPYQTTTTARD